MSLERWRAVTPDWLVRRLLPDRRSYDRFHWNAEFRKLDRKKTFDRIYAEKHWGDSGSEIPYSGDGSRGNFATHFCSLVQPQLVNRGVKSLVDLGCGDFTVGALLAPLVDRYIGVDIAEHVVATNKRLHETARRQFLRADICTDSLPTADAAILRQVLQHLSNAEIAAVLENVLPRYPVVIVTEHVDLEPGSEPNIDIPHGPSVRADVGSGVWLTERPFNVAATVLGEIPFKRAEVLRTWIVETGRS